MEGLARRIAGEAIPAQHAHVLAAHHAAHGGPHALEALVLATGLAIVVRLAKRVPRGSRARQALADAAVPLREELGD